MQKESQPRGLGTGLVCMCYCECTKVNMAASRSSRRCAGCGLDLETVRPYERRVLYGKKVLPAWDKIMGRKLKQLKLQIDRNEVVGSSDKPGYICRKCFGMYERYQNLEQDLLANAESALAVMPTVSTLSVLEVQTETIAAVLLSVSPMAARPGQKRQRSQLDDTSNQPKAKRSPLAPGSGKSPGVTVNELLASVVSYMCSVIGTCKNVCSMCVVYCMCSK